MSITNIAAVDDITSGSSSKVEYPSSAPSPTSLSRNAVNRSFSDLHKDTWFVLVSFNAMLRTLLLHPLYLAISRKRITREAKPPSVFSIIASAYRGEVGGGNNSSKKVRGLRAIYRGVGAAMIGNLIGELVYLHTMEWTKEALDVAFADANVAPERGRDFRTNSFSAAVGGMAGELASLLLVTPIVVVCNRQMTAGYGMSSSNTYGSLRDTLREVSNLYKQPGIGTSWGTARYKLRGLYAGLLPGIMTLPASGVWWALYSRSKAILYTMAEPTLSRWEREMSLVEEKKSPWQQNWLLSPTDNPALNAFAGVVASCVTSFLFNPVDVLHTRMQALPTVSGAVKGAQYTSLRTVVCDLLSAEGWRGLFKGTVANVGASVVGGVVFSSVFELTKLGSDRELWKQI